MKSSKCKQFALGQAMCILNSASGIIIQSLNQFFNVNLPFTMIAVFELLQVLNFVFKRNRQHITVKQLIIGMISGVIDTLSNLVNIIAYKYIDIESIQILLSTVVPFSLVFASLILKQKYSYKQIICGLINTLLAIVFMLQNYQEDQSKGQDDSNIIGGLLAVLSALGYSFDSIINEKYSKGVNPQQYASCMGVGGLTVSVVLSLVLEMPQYSPNPVVWILILANGMFMLIFYYIVIKICQDYSSVFYNIATLSTNVYSTAAAILIFGNFFQYQQILSAGGIIISNLVYAIASISSEQVKRQLDEQVKIVASSTIE